MNGIESMAEKKPVKIWFWALLLGAFVLGIAIRVFDLDDLPLDFHPTRQLHSLIIARGMYYQDLEAATPRQQEIAAELWQKEEHIEPQLTEQVTAWLYALAGGETIQVPRLVTIAFWLIGAVGFYLLVKDLFGIEGAVIGVAYFLLLPYGIKASRAFQPEPLMIAAITWSWWSLVKWIKNPNWIWTIITGFLAGFALLVKSPAVFFVIPPMAVVILRSQPFKQLFKNPRVWILVLLTVVPVIAYHVYGLFIKSFLGGQFSLRFFPNLWVDAFYYRRWKDLLDSTLVLELVLAALLGAFLIKDKTLRWMVLAVWIGYFAYGFVFAYHIHTHDYYQLPLLPAVGLGLASIASNLLEHIHRRKGLVNLVFCGLCMVWMIANATDTYLALKSADYRAQDQFWQDLGKKLAGGEVISMTEDYGYRLAYWGWTPSTNWLASFDFEYRELAGIQLDRNALFKEAIQGKDYFVITMFNELEKQPAVKQALLEGYTLLESNPGYMVFDLNSPLQGGVPNE